MSEVKRYTLWMVSESGCELEPYSEESPDGLYVHHADYAALEAECERLRVENIQLIEDRARFPDKPDFIGNMIAAHFGNLRAGQQQALEFAAKHRLRMERAEAQRDKLAKVLEDVEREHYLIRRMKNCEIQRGRGSFGIAVMSDPPALEWQAIDKELQQFVDARRAALAALADNSGKPNLPAGCKVVPVELLERVATHLEWDGSEPMTTIQYAYKCDELAAELRALLASVEGGE